MSEPQREPRTTRQWVVLGVAAVLLAALCLVAGRWQWNRYEAREAQIDLIEQNWSAAPVPFAEVLPGPGATLPEDAVWQPVTLTGRYVPDATVLLRNRPVNGTPGYHVLAPFDTGTVVIVVDRGFVPMGADGSAPDVVPAPPAGEVTVVASLRADEPPSSRGAPAGQVQAIATEQVLAAADRPDEWAAGRTVGAYGALRSESPAPEAPLAGLPAPDTDPGSHLSYAFQWCVFALGAIGGFVVLWRRERGALRGTSLTAGDLLMAEPDLRSSAVRRRTAEDEEDELIETQLGR